MMNNLSELSNTGDMDESSEMIGIKDIDVLNKRGIDLPEFNNVYGTDDVDVLDKPTDLDYVGVNGGYSNDDGEDSGSGNAGAISAGVGALGQLGANLIANAKAKKQDAQNMAIKSRCGKKPLLTITKKQKAKRATYNKCVDSVLNPAPSPAPAPAPSNQNKSGNSGGMSTGAIVALSLLGLTVIAIGGILIYKKINK